MRYIIKPSEKKSLIERQVFTKDGKTITEVCVWRWGSFSCESDEVPVINDGDDLYSSDYDLELIECTDGDTYYEFEGFTEEEEEEMRYWIEDNSFYDLENEGWLQDDSEMILNCEAEIEEA